MVIEIDSPGKISSVIIRLSLVKLQISLLSLEYPESKTTFSPNSQII